MTINHHKRKEMVKIIDKAQIENPDNRTVVLVRPQGTQNLEEKVKMFYHAHIYEGDGAGDSSGNSLSLEKHWQELRKIFKTGKIIFGVICIKSKTKIAATMNTGQRRGEEKETIGDCYQLLKYEESSRSTSSSRSSAFFLSSNTPLLIPVSWCIVAR